ncbi:MAG: hypothetical protein Q9Q13_12970 [Acidobacteriota bacterium]|nr:hypothetical protein [Acidobacteriota bacterium]
MLVLSTLGAVLAGIAPFWPLAAAGGAQAVFALVLRRRVEQTLAAAESRMPDLALVAVLLSRLERESFTSPALAALRAGLDEGAAPASRSIRRLARRIRWLEWRRNQIFMPLALLLAWKTHLALAIDRWQRRHGARVESWVQAVFEVEALASLAAFAWENPDHVMPEILPSEAPRSSREASGTH